MGIFTLFGAGMALQFEKHGTDSYVYRANGKGPALPVTEREADQFIRQGGVSFLLHVAAFMLAVIAAAMLTATWFPGGGEAGGFVLMGALLVAIGYALYRSIHWSMLAPARALAGRTPVAPARAGRPRRAQRPAGIGHAPQPPRKGSVLLVLAFVVAEIVGGILSGLIAYMVLSSTVMALAPTSGWDQPVGMIGGFLTGIVVVILIDRQCERKTGASWLDLLAAFH